MRRLTESPGQEVTPFYMPFPQRPWRHRRPPLLSPHHRAQDAILLSTQPQVLNARFTYGPLGVSKLSGEEVALFIIRSPPDGEWEHITTLLTDKKG